MHIEEISKLQIGETGVVYITNSKILVSRLTETAFKIEFKDEHDQTVLETEFPASFFEMMSELGELRDYLFSSK